MVGRNPWRRQYSYDSLLTWNKQLKVQPALAESYHIPNPLTYVFKLRKGVKFHSGKELDSEDVVYSMALQKSPPPPGVVNSYYPAIASVEAVDKYTVKFHMSRPMARSLMAKAGFSKGFDVTLQSIASPVDYTQVAQVVAEQLKAINVNVTVQPLEIGIFATNNGDGKFDRSFRW